jgi:hypothetical protein
MDQEKTTSVFIAYSRKDIDFLTELRTFLRPLEQNKGVEIWYDGEIVGRFGKTASNAPCMARILFCF